MAFVPMMSASPPPMVIEEDDDNEHSGDEFDGFGRNTFDDDDDYDLTGLSDKLHSIPVDAIRSIDVVLTNENSDNVIKVNGMGMPTDFDPRSLLKDKNDGLQKSNNSFRPKNLEEEEEEKERSSPKFVEENRKIEDESKEDHDVESNDGSEDKDHEHNEKTDEKAVIEVNEKDASDTDEPLDWAAEFIAQKARDQPKKIQNNKEGPHFISPEVQTESEKIGNDRGLPDKTLEASLTETNENDADWAAGFVSSKSSSSSLREPGKILEDKDWPSDFFTSKAAEVVHNETECSDSGSQRLPEDVQNEENLPKKAETGKGLAENDHQDWAAGFVSSEQEKTVEDDEPHDWASDFVSSKLTQEIEGVDKHVHSSEEMIASPIKDESDKPDDWAAGFVSSKPEKDSDKSQSDDHDLESGIVSSRPQSEIEPIDERADWPSEFISSKSQLEQDKSEQNDGNLVSNFNSSKSYSELDKTENDGEPEDWAASFVSSKPQSQTEKTVIDKDIEDWPAPDPVPPKLDHEVERIQASEEINDDDFGDFEEPVSQPISLGPSLKSMELILNSLKPKVESVISNLFGNEMSDDDDDESPAKNENSKYDFEEDPIWRKIREISSSPGLSFAWDKSKARASMMSTLKIDSRNILYDEKWKSRMGLSNTSAAAAAEAAAPGDDGSFISVLEPVKVDSTKTSPTLQRNNSSEKIPPVEFNWQDSGLQNPLATDEGLKSNNKAEFEDSSSSSSKATTILKTSSSKSREAAAILESFPLLNFMQASVLQFPVSECQ